MSVDLSEWRRCKWISSGGGYVFWYRASCADTLSQSVLHQIWDGSTFFWMGVVPGYRRGVYSQGKTKVGTWLFTLGHLRDPVVPNKKYIT